MQNKASPRADIDATRTLPVILAGLAGGVMEIVWITFYSSLTSTSAANIARQISATVMPFAMDQGRMLTFGVGVHLFLSIMLAAVFVGVLYGPVVRRFGARGVFISGLTTLSAVWAVNFFVLLPVLNPAFPLLMPYAVTLTSKLLFGAAMTWVLNGRSRPDAQRIASVPPQ